MNLANQKSGFLFATKLENKKTIQKIVTISLICFVTVLFGVSYASADTWTTLDMPGARETFISGISGNNIVGYYYNDTSNHIHGFLYNGAAWTTLDAPGAMDTYPLGDDGNNIVGSYTDTSGRSHGFLYNGTTWTTVDVPWGTETFISGISGNNIVGYHGSNITKFWGFLYNGTTWINLDVPGAHSTLPSGIFGNNIVGFYTNALGVHGFLYNGATWTTLDAPGAVDTYTSSIFGNNIVGYYGDTLTFHGFLYNGTSWITLDAPWGTETVISGISGNNIVGTYDDIPGHTHGFLYTIPQSNPPTLSGLGQFDGATSIPEGQILRHPYISSFSAIVSDPDGDLIQLQVELRRFEEPFTGTDDGGIFTSDLVPSENIARVPEMRDGVRLPIQLSDGKYHWRARAIDSDGNKSGWQEFGVAGNVDFEIREIDTDGDGLLDQHEISIGTNPQNPDTDGDGIKDGHEVSGVDVNGDASPDLFFPQANPRRKDIFVEVDCMVDRCNNSNIFFETFTEGVFDTVRDVFANAPVSNYDGTQGISIHFLVDEIDVPLEDSIGEEWFNTAGKEFFGTKDERQDADKNEILRSKTEDFLFHYVLFVNKYEGGGGAGEEPGNDLVIENTKVPILGFEPHDVQSSKLLHELGHNLGLGHGGRVRLEGEEEMTPDDTNCKPNYLSSMNYSRSYDIKYGFLEFRTLPRVFDFSSEALPTLHENALNESVGIGTNQLTIFGPPPSIIANGLSIDWNRDGDTTDEDVSEVVIGGRTTPTDINWISDKMSDCGSNTETHLEGSNDWGNLLFDARGYPGFTRGFFDASQNNGLIVEQDAQEVIAEMKIIGRTIVGDQASIDIKPGSHENPINCRSQSGVIPVAVLTSQEFNSTDINPSSVLFGYLGREAQAIEDVLHLEDVDVDGDLDAVFHFRAQDAGIKCGDTKALLTGEYTNGIPFWGEDGLVTVGGKK